MHDVFSQPKKLSEVIDAIDRLVSATEKLGNAIAGLGGETDSRYTPHGMTEEVVNEKQMSEILGITRRSLADYRRKGKLPNCWVKNGRKIRWHLNRTIDAWRKGIS